MAEPSIAYKESVAKAGSPNSLRTACGFTLLCRDHRGTRARLAKEALDCAVEQEA
jgi:hypothetical protein